MDSVVTKLKEGSKASYELLDQIEERNFDDIKKYRTYQLALINSETERTEYKDIDHILNSLGNYKVKEDPYILDNEEWKDDQLERASKKIVKEIESYETLIETLAPEKQVRGKSKDQSKYDLLTNNLDLVKRGFEKLYEESDREFTKPFRKIN